jgi:hypothetical protein
MKDVVRKKLGVATSVPIYLSQLREGRSVDLEDGTLPQNWVTCIPCLISSFSTDDDFEAFDDFVHVNRAAWVNVIVTDSEVNKYFCHVMCHTKYFVGSVTCGEEEEEENEGVQRYCVLRYLIAST